MKIDYWVVGLLIASGVGCAPNDRAAAPVENAAPLAVGKTTESSLSCRAPFVLDQIRDAVNNLEGVNPLYVAHLAGANNDAKSLAFAWAIGVNNPDDFMQEVRESQAVESYLRSSVVVDDVITTAKQVGNSIECQATVRLPERPAPGLTADEWAFTSGTTWMATSKVQRTDDGSKDIMRGVTMCEGFACQYENSATAFNTTLSKGAQLIELKSQMDAELLRSVCSPLGPFRVFSGSKDTRDGEWTQIETDISVYKLRPASGQQRDSFRGMLFKGEEQVFDTERWFVFSEWKCAE